MTSHSRPDQNPTTPASTDSSEISEIIENSIPEGIQVEGTRNAPLKEVNDQAKQKSKRSKKSLGGGLYKITKNDILVEYRFIKMIAGNIIDTPLGKMTELQARREIEKLIKKPSELQRAKNVVVKYFRTQG